MKVCIVNSSPRYGGNCDVLCQQFAKGAEDAGHVVERINLREKEIHQCLGCYGCRNTHVCVRKDDMQDVLQKLIEADVIVLASPVYFYSVSGQMKVMIDRCVANHKAIAGKQFYFIVTAAASAHEAADGTLAAFRGFLRCLPEPTEKGIIYGTGAWEKGDIYELDAFKGAYNTGLHL